MCGAPLTTDSWRTRVWAAQPALLALGTAGGATADGAALYARLGFDRVDTEVPLGPPASPTGT